MYYRPIISVAVSLFSLLNLHVLVCRADSVIKVDVSSDQTSYQYVAGRDSEGLQYRCVSNGNSTGLTWMYNGVDRGSLLNAYQFYGRNNDLKDYTVECHSSSGKIGEMTLTLKDDVRFNVTYSGTVRTFTRTNGIEQTILIPENTTDVVFTCEVSRGSLTTPDRFVPPTTNPSIEIPVINNNKGTGLYQCRRQISSPFRVLSLNVTIGEPTTTTTPTHPTTTHTTTPTSAELFSTQISAYIIPMSAVIAILLILLIISCPLILILICICVKIRIRRSKHTNQSNEYIQFSTTNPGKSATSKKKKYLPLKSPTSLSPSSTLGQSPDRNKLSNNIQDKPLPIDEISPKGDNELGIVASNSDDIDCPVAYDIFTNDKLSPNKPDVPLDELKQHIDTMWSDGMLDLRREFDELQLNIMRGPILIAKESCNIKFNRETMMLPYDRSRVRLTAVDTSDYINASLIPGPFTQQTFIAAQLPMHATSDRFWSMLWEQKVTTVLMVSTREESDHMYRYWPPVGETQVLGELRVRTVSAEDTEEVLVSHCVSLSLSSSSEQVRELVLLEFRGWPENEHCMMSHDILRCVRSVRDGRGVKGLRSVEIASDDEEKVSPICVCCVTGSGRTGAMISVYNLLECVESGSGSVSVFNCVNGMRNHRPYMVQTLNQYRMLYTGLLEMVAGDTSVDVKGTFLSEDMVVKEFAELEYQCEKSFERSSNVGVKGSENSDTPLPYDDTRVVLDAPLHTSYYNASYIRSTLREEFIAAVSPRSEEVSQLMEIVFQHKCPLVVALGVHNNNNNLAKYWEVAGVVKLGRLRMKKLSSIEINELFICEIRLELVSGGSHTFQHVYCSTWTSAGVSSTYNSVLKLLDILLQCEDRTHPVLVHCEDGAGVSEMLLSVLLAVRGRRGCEADLFQTCKHLRFHRRRMVSTTEQYKICYEILKRYFKVYLDKTSVNPANIS